MWEILDVLRRVSREQGSRVRSCNTRFDDITVVPCRGLYAWNIRAPSIISHRAATLGKGSFGWTPTVSCFSELCRR